MDKAFLQKTALSIYHCKIKFHGVYFSHRICLSRGFHGTLLIDTNRFAFSAFDVPHQYRDSVRGYNHYILNFNEKSILF